MTDDEMKQKLLQVDAMAIWQPTAPGYRDVAYMRVLEVERILTDHPEGPDSPVRRFQMQLPGWRIDAGLWRSIRDYREAPNDPEARVEVAWSDSAVRLNAGESLPKSLQNMLCEKITTDLWAALFESWGKSQPETD